ncbi:DUF1850 domain-containing protein [Denitromonas iodatirespirans]|uniref:DUF1850 domain-containing protein n=1 Tax=Denitromonas iodatirespirans TaxID=2795389 RepID=A0A944DAV7_DENI1|nr:DUF1850 domain-containing protein [Denitromonas iodatirespirans]MBT0961067.1 DUF1850 domain-containing protein [Denitromonas iodatirespirans]
MRRFLPLLAALLLGACAHPPIAPAPQLCLSSDGLLRHLPGTQLTVSWMHSIEKIRWEEDWQLDDGQLVLVEARVRGSGAGMEPAPGARLIDGVWHYRVPRREDRLALTHSPFTAGYTLCAAGQCRPLVDWLPGLPEIAWVDVRACAPAVNK